MQNERLRKQWHSIASALGRALKEAENLPRWERDSEFSEWLEHALLHAERRADALIDPS